MRVWWKVRSQELYNEEVDKDVLSPVHVGLAQELSRSEEGAKGWR